MEDVDLPLRVGRTRIGSADEDDDDSSTILSDMSEIRKRNTSTTSVSGRSTTNLTTTNTGTSTAVSELDSGPAVAEVEGDKPIAELAGSGALEKEAGVAGAVELDASQAYVELPGDLEKKMSVSGGGRGMGEVKTRLENGV